MNLAELFRHETNLKALPSCETLFKEGGRGDLMYVLMSGTADIIVHNQVVETIEPGAIVGEMAMIDEGGVPRPSSQRVIANFCPSTGSASIS